MGSILITVDHSEPVIVDRVTRGGRHLWYHLEVIQQPERARACGAGPKSSADRRPVDPPPVVELRIFEGPTLEHAKDITFTYNANFFLYTTLEHARVLAHGRVQTPSTATPPVLTGMPVSGMAYLDRPKEAGYFLFPDLSVRHEGRYRLTFNLFEQTKETADLTKDLHDGSTAPAESFDWRMEVKSHDFMVFSAKKFPGLTESTALSRTVAEQGCRVRIRRDVRMRRREGKSSAAAAGSGSDARAKDEYAAAAAHRHRTQTPEVGGDYRARSMSTESIHRAPYIVPDTPHTQRRPSIPDYNSISSHAAPSPQPGPAMPPAFSSAASGQQGGSGSHIWFNDNNGNNQQQPPNTAQTASVPPSPTNYSTPTHPYTQSQQHGHHGPHAQHPPHPQHAQHHSSSSFSAPPPSPSQAPPSSSHSYYHDRPASQHYTIAPSSAPSPAPSPALSPRRDSFASMDHRRMSGSYGAPPPLSAQSGNDRRADAPRLGPGLPSPSEAKSLTLPSLSEMIAFQSDKQAPPSNGSASSNANNGNKSSHSHAGNTGGGGVASPNSDRVPSLSQLLLPQPVLPDPLSNAAAMNKKRSYGQYNNHDPAADAYVASTSVKNHARQPETASCDIEELWWKRADGSVWTAHGEVAYQRG